MVALGSDQAGYELKQVIKKHLEERGLEYKDYGSYSPDPVDYPVYGKKVAHAIVNGECDRGILICGTGIGISIAANKVPGIRAALCSDCFSAEATRLHNDANILAFGARVVGPGLAEKIVDTFLDTEFSGRTACPPGSNAGRRGVAENVGCYWMRQHGAGDVEGDNRKGNLPPG